MDSQLTYHEALAALAWQVDLGVDEAIAEHPVDRYALSPPEPPTPKPAQAKPTAKPIAPERAQPPAAAPGPDAMAAALDAARLAAGSAQDLPGLRAAMEGYEHCELKRGARQLVFSDGTAGARVMIVGEAPGRDEDREGKPFVGRAGQLLDRMLAAIDLTRDGAPDAAVYITNVLPWRPPQNRTPSDEEIAMMLPFLERHVALADPDILVLMGNVSCQAGLGQKGILRLRGNWAEAFGKPALPMTHPAYLLRNPAAKREAWADLLSLRARLGGKTGS